MRWKRFCSIQSIAASRLYQSWTRAAQLHFDHTRTDPTRPDRKLKWNSWSDLTYSFLRSYSIFAKFTNGNFTAYTKIDWNARIKSDILKVTIKIFLTLIHGFYWTLGPNACQFYSVRDSQSLVTQTIQKLGWLQLLMRHIRHFLCDPSHQSWIIFWPNSTRGRIIFTSDSEYRKLYSTKSSGTNDSTWPQASISSFS